MRLSSSWSGKRRGQYWKHQEQERRTHQRWQDILSRKGRRHVANRHTESCWTSPTCVPTSSAQGSLCSASAAAYVTFCRLCRQPFWQGGGQGDSDSRFRISNDAQPLSMQLLAVGVSSSLLKKDLSILSSVLISPLLLHIFPILTSFLIYINWVANPPCEWADHQERTESARVSSRCWGSEQLCGTSQAGAGMVVTTIPHGAVPGSSSKPLIPTAVPIGKKGAHSCSLMVSEL